MNSLEIKHTRIKGKDVLFYCPYPEDHIQKFHLSGKFYEELELELLQELVPPHSDILEVGANLGNHLIYYATFLNPKSITWVEPNPVSVAVLDKNCSLNKLPDSVILSGHPGVAFSNAAGKGAIHFYPKNIGGAQVNHHSDGSVQLVKGDDYLKGLRFDFIKLDTEKQDIEALEGLATIIRNSRPVVFVEIYDSRFEEFKALLAQLNYSIHFITKRYKLNTNYLILPKK